MSILKAIAEFLGAVLKELIPALFKESRKAREVEQIGNDEDLKNDMDSSIEKSLEDK